MLIKNIETIDSPALLVFPEKVKQNISRLIEMARDPARLRPHVKTNKSPDVCNLLLKAGITKFKCATIAEAEMLGMQKAPDTLLAYQPVGPKVARLLELISRYPSTHFSCLVDNPGDAEALDTASREKNIVLSVFIDINAGMNRTGILPGDQALALYQSCSKMKNIEPVGLHAYDGNLHDPDINIRKKKCDEGFAAVLQLKERIIKAGLPSPILVAGGSPGFPIHVEYADRECSPGTFVFWDRGYQIECPEQPFEPAAILLTRVISVPGPNRICLDLGHKAVAAENELGRRIYFPDHPDLTPISQSEEHLVMESGDHKYKPGDVLYGIPYHICPTVALYDRVVIIENQQPAGEWKILARNRKINV